MIGALWLYLPVDPPDVIGGRIEVGAS